MVKNCVLLEIDPFVGSYHHYFINDLAFFMQVPASQLIHPSKEPAAIRLWHDQLFAKPPKHGGVVAW